MTTPKSAPVDIDSPAFRAWFAGSRVADDRGRPLRVYHGTADPSVAFDGGPAWFTTNTDDASFYAESSTPRFLDTQRAPCVTPMFLSLRNPKDLSRSIRLPSQIHAALAQARSEGHDGALMPAPQGGFAYVVFTQSQIKSAVSEMLAADIEDDIPRPRP